MRNKIKLSQYKLYYSHSFSCVSLFHSLWSILSGPHLSKLRPNLHRSVRKKKSICYSHRGVYECVCTMEIQGYAQPAVGKYGGWKHPKIFKVQKASPSHFREGSDEKQQEMHNWSRKSQIKTTETIALCCFCWLKIFWFHYQTASLGIWTLRAYCFGGKKKQPKFYTGHQLFGKMWDEQSEEP